MWPPLHWTRCCPFFYCLNTSRDSRVAASGFRPHRGPDQGGPLSSPWGRRLGATLRVGVTLPWRSAIFEVVMKSLAFCWWTRVGDHCVESAAPHHVIVCVCLCEWGMWEPLPSNCYLKWTKKRFFLYKKIKIKHVLKKDSALCVCVFILFQLLLALMNVRCASCCQVEGKIRTGKVSDAYLKSVQKRKQQQKLVTWSTFSCTQWRI